MKTSSIKSLSKAIFLAITSFIIMGVTLAGYPTTVYELFFEQRRFLSAYFHGLPHEMAPRLKYAKIGGWLRTIYGDGSQGDGLEVRDGSSSVNIHYKDLLNHTVLVLAAFIGDEVMVDRIIAGFDRNLPRDAYLRNFKDALSHAVFYPPDATEAEKAGRLGIIDKLLAAGADLNEGGVYYKNPFHRAINFKRWDAAKYLLEKGSRVYPENDYNFRGPLMQVIGSCDREFVETMVQRGAKFLKSDIQLTESSIMRDKVRRLKELRQDINRCGDEAYTQRVEQLIFDHTGLDLNILEAEHSLRAQDSLNPFNPLQKVEENEFFTRRYLDEYKQLLGVRDLIGKLAPGDLVIDGGSGETIAMQQLVSLKRKIKAIALTYKLPDKRWEELKAFQMTHPEEFSLCVGDFNEMTNEGILGSMPGLNPGQSAKIIFEVWGILAYSRCPDRILARYLELLDDDGVIALRVGDLFFEDLYTKHNNYISYYSKPTSTLYRTLVQKFTGEVVTFPEWLEGLPGLRIEKVQKCENVAWHIRKARGADGAVVPSVIPLLEWAGHTNKESYPEGHFLKERRASAL
jgi:hypothetical protein